MASVRGMAAGVGDTQMFVWCESTSKGQEHMGECKNMKTRRGQIDILKPDKRPRQSVLCCDLHQNLQLHFPAEFTLIRM